MGEEPAEIVSPVCLSLGYEKAAMKNLYEDNFRPGSLMIVD
jgi:hypothetical protein